MLDKYEPKIYNKGIKLKGERKMKKRIAVVLSLVLVSVFALTACSAAGGVKKNFENEGYTVEVIEYKDYDENIRKQMEANADEDDLKILKKIKFMNITKNKLPVATVYVYPSKAKLKELMDSGEEGTYDSMVEQKLINGNCVLMPTGGLLNLQEITDIFSK